MPRADPEARLRWPTFAVVLAAVLVAVLVAAWVAGSSGTGSGSTDATRLGPEPGETVAGYLARTRDVPPGPPGPRLALVAFAPEQDGPGALALLGAGDAAPTEAVFRVPLDRVQTALRRVRLDTSGAVDPLTALRQAETQAANQATDTARTGTGRAAAVAAAESSRLGAGCACVVALVVTLDPAAARGIAARPGVSALQVAPPGAGALAVSPLLPEQVAAGTVGPVPDDGPVPTP